MREISDDSLRIIREFLSTPSKRYLFGATPYSAGIISKIQVRGVIDDFASTSSFHGVPVIRTHEAPHDALVVATILGRPHSAKKHLERSGLLNCDYFIFHRYSEIDLPFARFWTGVKEDSETHRHELAWARSLLSDALSIDIFDRIVNFRRSANLMELDGFFENQVNQYFEDFLGLKYANETFLDIGCFDGKTSIQFKKRCPEFKQIHIFEPDPSNFKVVRSLFSSDPRIICHAFGLSSYATTASFCSSGSTSAVSTKGDITVELRTLDSVALRDVTFVKVDVEGSERDVLTGAHKLISLQRPSLAIAVYHRPSDLWSIPKEVMSIRADYDVYLRHYTEGVTETVMFFVPKK